MWAKQEPDCDAGPEAADPALPALVVKLWERDAAGCVIQCVCVCPVIKPLFTQPQSLAYLI